MAISRVVRPELLDGLEVTDPSALRSRSDLRMINAMMGNFRWIEGELAPWIEPGSRVVEIGAGEGRLARRLAEAFPRAQVSGVDLVPRPEGLPADIGWEQGDLFQGLSGDILAGVMIVHHFDDGGLRRLGEMLAGFRVICLCEPWRAVLAHLWGGLMWPLIGEVTKHDMVVSIDAGFVRGELPRLLNLAGWHVRESIDWRGSCRLVAWRN